MSVSEAVRKAVMDRDNRECQFWHREPVPATEISHRDHQGIGGLPEDHWKNQAGNLAASCEECHRRFSGPGKVNVWEEFIPAIADSFVAAHDVKERGRMVIRAPSGELVPEESLWFYARWAWLETQGLFIFFKNLVPTIRANIWRMAKELLWFKESGFIQAIQDETITDYLDVAASQGITSGEAKRAVRLAKFTSGLSEEAREAVEKLDLAVADRLRKLPETELVEVAGWFDRLPPALAWANFDDRYRKSKPKKYRVFSGPYREITATSDGEFEQMMLEWTDKPSETIVVKGGSVIAGVRQEVEE